MKSKTIRSFAIVLTSSTFLLTACSSGGHDMSTMDGMNMDKPLKADISFATAPAKLVVGQEAQLIETVVSAGKPVDDADVEMEVWLDGDASHEKVKATADGAGKYLLKKTFTKPGLYHATLHTTANDMHQMPTKDFQVSAAT